MLLRTRELAQSGFFCLLIPKLISEVLREVARVLRGAASLLRGEHVADRLLDFVLALRRNAATQGQQLGGYPLDTLAGLALLVELGVAECVLLVLGEADARRLLPEDVHELLRPHAQVQHHVGI